MKFSSLIASAIAALFLLVSCGKKTDYSTFVHDNLGSSQPEYGEKYDSIFIIPRRGCTSCTYLADKIVKEHWNNERNLFLFTNLKSEKLMRIEFGKEVFTKPNVILDKDKVFWKKEFEESTYPVLFVKDQSGHYTFQYLLDVMQPTK